VKKTNLLIVSGLVILVFVIFISGKRSIRSADHNELNNIYTAGAGIYYNISERYDDLLADELDNRFRKLNKRGIFNGTVLYAENDRIVFEGAYGYKDFRKKDAMTLNSAFQLASVSKMFTAYAIMLLHQQGKLEYDDTIGRFIPEFPYPEVTLRQLMNHRSGLSRYMSLADAHWDINKPINNEQVIGLFVKYKPAPYFQPDNGFHYCNTNYALLASVVERISGMHFDEFMKKNVFGPLKMDNTFVYNLRGDEEIPATIPVGIPGYYLRGRRIVKAGDYYLNGVMGDKGVYSTVEDLFRFNCALDNGTLVSLANLQEAFSPGSPKYRGRHDNYGFGWRIKDDMDSTVYHFGWWKGFRSYFVRDMVNQRTMIVLTNTHSGASSNVYWDIIQDSDRPEKLKEIYKALN